MSPIMFKKKAMAEREGFEPSRELLALYTISNRALSSTQSPLRNIKRRGWDSNPDRLIALHRFSRPAPCLFGHPSDSLFISFLLFQFFRLSPFVTKLWLLFALLFIIYTIFCSKAISPIEWVGGRVFTFDIHLTKVQYHKINWMWNVKTRPHYPSNIIRLIECEMWRHDPIIPPYLCRFPKSGGKHGVVLII